MATITEDETKECTFQWKIKNVSSCWWLRNGDEIESPNFIADALLGTKWSLLLYLMGDGPKNSIGFYLRRQNDCTGPDVMEINYQLAFLGIDGSILSEHSFIRQFKKSQKYGYMNFECSERVFVREREAFLPGDTLTVQCTVQKVECEIRVNSKYLYGRTILNVNEKSCIWKIDKFSTPKSVVRNKFKDTQFEFDIVLNEDSDRLDLYMISFDNSVKYISIKIAVINSDGKKENFGIKNYFISDLKKGILYPVISFDKKLMENKSHYLPNDTLSLDLEFSFSTVENFGCGENSAELENDAAKRNECCIEEEVSQDINLLTDDLKCVYKDGILSDTELRTSTKSFPVHKIILSARSPVFRRMFSSDMKEVYSGHAIIDDFEEDIVHRMLLYLYTDTLEDLKYENASELYKIADKYEILSLKSKCSSFLKDNLCPTKVCDVLILADLHQDINLKKCAQDYIMDHNEVFSSTEWENFMNDNIHLAADIMYKKVNPGKIYKGKM